jgi:hypothetical protein
MQVETWVHWLRPGSGPKLTDEDWLVESPYNQIVIWPRAPERAAAVTTSASAQKLSPALVGREMS